MSQPKKPPLGDYPEWFTPAKQNHRLKISNHNDNNSDNNNNMLDQKHGQDERYDSGQQRGQGRVDGRFQRDFRAHSAVGLGSGNMSGNTQNPFQGVADGIHEHKGNNIVGQLHGNSYGDVVSGDLRARASSNSFVQYSNRHVNNNMIDQRGDRGYGDMGFEDLGGNTRNSSMQLKTSDNHNNRYHHDDEDEDNRHPQSRSFTEHTSYQFSQNYGFRAQGSPPPRYDAGIEHGDFPASRPLEMTFNTNPPPRSPSQPRVLGSRPRPDFTPPQERQPKKAKTYSPDTDDHNEEQPSGQTENQTTISSNQSVYDEEEFPTQSSSSEMAVFDGDGDDDDEQPPSQILSSDIPEFDDDDPEQQLTGEDGKPLCLKVGLLVERLEVRIVAKFRRVKHPGLRAPLSFYSCSVDRDKVGMEPKSNWSFHEITFLERFQAGDEDEMKEAIRECLSQTNFAPLRNPMRKSGDSFEYIDGTYEEPPAELVPDDDPDYEQDDDEDLDLTTPPRHQSCGPRRGRSCPQDILSTDIWNQSGSPAADESDGEESTKNDEEEETTQKTRFDALREISASVQKSMRKGSRVIIELEEETRRKNDTIASLRKRMAEKDRQIQQKDDTIAAQQKNLDKKDEMIKKYRVGGSNGENQLGIAEQLGDFSLVNNSMQVHNNHQDRRLSEYVSSFEQAGDIHQTKKVNNWITNPAQVQFNQNLPQPKTPLEVIPQGNHPTQLAKTIPINEVNYRVMSEINRGFLLGKLKHDDSYYMDGKRWCDILLLQDVEVKEFVFKNAQSEKLVEVDGVEYREVVQSNGKLVLIRKQKTVTDQNGKVWQAEVLRACVDAK